MRSHWKTKKGQDTSNISRKFTENLAGQEPTEAKEKGRSVNSS